MKVASLLHMLKCKTTGEKPIKPCFRRIMLHEEYQLFSFSKLAKQETDVAIQASILYNNQTSPGRQMKMYARISPVKCKVNRKQELKECNKTTPMSKLPQNYLICLVKHKK